MFVHVYVHNVCLQTSVQRLTAHYPEIKSVMKLAAFEQEYTFCIYTCSTISKRGLKPTVASVLKQTAFTMSHNTVYVPQAVHRH